MVRLEVLDDVRMSNPTQDAALLLKQHPDPISARVSDMEEGRVEDFGSTGQVANLCFVNGAIRANPESILIRLIDDHLTRYLCWLKAVCVRQRDARYEDGHYLEGFVRTKTVSMLSVYLPHVHCC